MKAKNLFIAMLFGVSLSAIGCNKCVTCTQAGATDVEICKKDYNGNQAAYDAAVGIQEAFGATCN